MLLRGIYFAKLSVQPLYSDTYYQHIVNPDGSRIGMSYGFLLNFYTYQQYIVHLFQFVFPLYKVFFQCFFLQVQWLIIYGEE